MGILVAQPGMEPMPSALEAWTLNHWTSREVPKVFLIKVICQKTKNMYLVPIICGKTRLIKRCMYVPYTKVMLKVKETRVGNREERDSTNNYRVSAVFQVLKKS